jgi:hypothetical protein
MSCSSDWLASKGQEYRNRLRDEELVFLGELHLSECETDELFRDIRRCRYLGASDDLRAALAVAAVHAAVYAAESATSYISVFLSRLQMPNENRAWEEYGWEILHFLSEHFNEEDRPGAFRYVRPILNHAGISYRALPAFAKFVDKLFSSCGPSFTVDEYERCSASVSSSFARRFLVEGPGLEFTRDVIRILERYKYGAVPTESLDHLPGYRPGFWRELLEHMPPSQGSATAPAKRFADPAEYLDLDNSRLVWRFDGQGVASRAYRMNGTVVNFTTENIRSPRVFGGTVQPDGTYTSWELNAWGPGAGDIGLFRASDGRFVTAGGDQGGEFTTVTPGRYYAVAPSHITFPVDNVVEEGSWLEDDSDADPHRTWCINLEPGSELKHLGIRATGSAVPSLSFTATDATPFSLTAVFSRVLPAVRVKGWSEAASRNYTVLLDVGSGPTCQDSAISEGMLCVKVPVPSQGRLWIEPRGRSRHPSLSLSNLSFTVLPSPLRWVIPTEPYGMSDEVPIVLESEAAATVDWKSPVQQVMPGRWKLQPGFRVAEGTIRISNLRVPFSIPVPRTAIYAPGVGHNVPVIWIDEEPRHALLAWALPGEPAALELQDQDGSWKLWDIGVIPSSGRRELTTGAFRDYLLEAQFAAAQLGLRVRQKTNWSHIYLVSSKRIEALLPKAVAGWTAFEIPVIGPLLMHLHFLHERRLDRIDIDERVLETALGRYVADCAFSAEAIDGTAVVGPKNLREHCSLELQETIKELLSCADGVKHEPESQPAPDFSRIPVKRIREIAEANWDKSNRALRIGEMVLEWRTEVTAPLSAAPSRVSQLQGGKDLTAAARSYVRVVPSGTPSQYNLLVARLGRKPTPAEDQLCTILRAALYQLALYRSGRRRTASEVQLDEVPPQLARLRAQMADLRCQCIGLPVLGDWPKGVGFAQVSPAEIDMEIETMLLKGVGTFV